jgi:hypothetical protein
VDEALAIEADAFARTCGRGERARFRRFRSAVGDGVAVAFYRADRATLLAVLLDQDRPERWTALGAAEVCAGGSRAISIRPSERGDWIVAIYGSAPPGTSVAVIDFADEEHRVPVDDGTFAFMMRSTIELEPTLTKPRFE